MSQDHNHKNGECCSEDSHHHHCCAAESAAHCHDSSCHEHHCCDEQEHCHEEKDFYCTLLELADEAWMDVLKCKIKEQIKTNSGAHLDELAKIVSDANHCRWKHKIETRKGSGDFKRKVRNFFDNCGDKGQC